MKRGAVFLVLVFAAVALTSFWIAGHFDRDMKAARVDAHVCLLDALNIGRAAIVGGSAGGPSALQIAIRHPERVERASPEERLRVNTIVDHILPVSSRAAGLRSDSMLGKILRPSNLASVQAPTLIVSVRDDGFGTYASAQYTASQIKGAKFVGYEQGGHVWVGHQPAVQAQIMALLMPEGAPLK